MSAKSVLVTGGAKRVGRAIVERFAAAGWHVVIHYNSSAEAAEALRGHLAQMRQMPTTDEENFRLVNSFNDIFVTIAAVLLLVAMAGIGTAIVPGLAGALVLYLYVRRQSTGTDLMVELAARIHEGSMAFLRRELS